MHEESSSAPSMPFRNMVMRFAVMIGAASLFGVFSTSMGLEARQGIACSVFLAIILGTLMFWGFRLAIAFLGLAVLVCTSSLTIPEFIQSSALDVILFLVGMMIVVGALRDLGFFTWVVQKIVDMPNISGRKFIAVTAAASALLACAVDEVTSIIFVSTLIFQVCDRLKLNPTPYILISVLATNVGSAGTMMGNPVGIFIGTKAQLSFGDFMTWSFPLMLVALALTIAVSLVYYRKELAQFDLSLKERLARNLTLVPTVEVPYRTGLFLLAAVILAIASHHQLESLLGLRPNSVLIIAPLVCAGLVMIARPSRARHYVEREVDWWTLLFFMLLFAIAGTLEHTGVAEKMAHGFTQICGNSQAVLVPAILAISAIGSAFVDNVIFVAAFCPVIEELSVSINGMPLWWALLFGACIGGNITMIGSTANIVALGMLEKRAHSQMKFFYWLKIGALSALVAGAVVWGGLSLLAPFMPDRPVQLKLAQLDREFNGKNVIVQGALIEEAAWPLRLPEGISPDTHVLFGFSEVAGGPSVDMLVAAPKEGEYAFDRMNFHGRLYRYQETGQPAVLVLEKTAAL